MLAPHLLDFLIFWLLLLLLARGLVRLRAHGLYGTVPLYLLAFSYVYLSFRGITPCRLIVRLFSRRVYPEPADDGNPTPESSAHSQALSGAAGPVGPPSEATFADLKARVAKTLDFVKTVNAAQLKDAESRAIEIKFPSGSWKFTGIGYLTDFVLPNFYFHVGMVYALLRKSGVEIGKGDYLGAIQ